jgi:hypothetical protein
MEPITGLDKVSKQRWKLVNIIIALDRASTDVFHAEMFHLWDSRRGLHSMQQDVVFSCVPCDMRPQGEVLDANEKRTRA